MKYCVIREFIDSRTGKSVKPGETTEASEQEAERMRAAGVIGDAVESGAEEDKPKRRKAEG